MPCTYSGQGTISKLELAFQLRTHGTLKSIAEQGHVGIDLGWTANMIHCPWYPNTIQLNLKNSTGTSLYVFLSLGSKTNLGIGLTVDHEVGVEHGRAKVSSIASNRNSTTAATVDSTGVHLRSRDSHSAALDAEDKIGEGGIARNNIRAAVG